MQCNPKVFDLRESEPTSHVYFYGPIEPETTYEVTITIGRHGETALERFLGCVMMGIMPDEGLEEALYSLRDMVEFYNRQPLPHHSPLTSAPIDATIVGRKKRPDLVIT